MSSAQEVREQIVKLLKSYPSMKQKIALLRHEWENPARITDDEMLEAMVFGKGEPGSRPSIGHISDKTYHIAVNYRGQAAYQNRTQVSEIASELERMEKKVYRLEYCVSQMAEEQRQVIQGLYFENMEQKALVSRLSLSDSTIRRYRDKGLDTLTEMYLTLMQAGAVIEW